MKRRLGGVERGRDGQKEQCNEQHELGAGVGVGVMFLYYRPNIFTAAFIT